MNAPNEYLRIREISAATGLSQDTVRRAVHDGRLPAVQLGGRGAYLVDSADFRAALRRTAPDDTKEAR